MDINDKGFADAVIHIVGRKCVCIIAQVSYCVHFTQLDILNKKISIKSSKNNLQYLLHENDLKKLLDV